MQARPSTAAMQKHQQKKQEPLLQVEKTQFLEPYGKNFKEDQRRWENINQKLRYTDVVLVHCWSE